MFSCLCYAPWALQYAADLNHLCGLPDGTPTCPDRLIKGLIIGKDMH